MLELTADQIGKRRPLWWALSDLLLDTDLPHVWGVNIARAMHEGGFTLEQAHSIFCGEVGPAFISNLYAVAGEWAGWDESFVAERVLMRLRRPRPLRRLTSAVARRQLQALWDHTLPHLVRELSVLPKAKTPSAAE